ncbi:hypothetical protein OSB04_020200 [Centaurea solstitialis]|uniref:Piezo non-specific cation channel R-Ras-binding domain-containing protein n=1 Tax=Centaurea solstitialis TaxID=347529 RepID=A0AA38W3M7_9ASTR|nr:hypothetical protein OSB04_020200 [Centaurea solstitialis]
MDEILVASLAIAEGGGFTKSGRDFGGFTGEAEADIGGDLMNYGEIYWWICVAFAAINSCFTELEFDISWQFASLLAYSIHSSKKSQEGERYYVTFLITWAIVCGSCNEEEPWWARLLGFMIVETWRSPVVIYLLVVQLLVAITAFIELHESRLGLFTQTSTFFGSFSLAFNRIGSHVKVAFCLLLPAVQLVVGISYSSWVSLPFFVCSCVGLVDWSLTSNFHGLFRWWRPLWMYGGFNIFLLYVHQLPLGFPKFFTMIGDFIGLYKISPASEWTQICSCLSLIVFCFMLSFVKFDLEEMDSIMSTREGNLAEHLLPLQDSFFIRESRSGVRHTNVLLRGAVFRTFSINFFTYGVPVSLFALCLWSFYFASVCAFGLLVYVGYIIFAFPSLFRLHRLNGLLLVFILLWALSTYIFNVAFSYLNWDLGDMDIWEMVGLWHYPIPGFFILAQFCLGVLVALGNLVNNSVFLYISDEDQETPNGEPTPEAKEETKVLIVATIAWGLRKCSRAIMLVLIFLIAMKPVIFFFLYLLSHDIGNKVRHTLLLLCEIHFALLYSLQITPISRALEKSGLSMEILSQLGLHEHNSAWDFVEIAFLACFCAVHKHGYKLLFSFSAIVQHTPCPPVGFSILKAGLNKSVLLSVYASGNARNSEDTPSQERKVASYLHKIGQKFLSLYRSLGTYIAFVTILVTVYMARPNFVSFGFIFLLLFWITGRQLVEKTKRRLWFPLKLYSISMFVLVYSLSIFPTFETWVSTKFDLYANLGYNPESSLLENVSESLAITIVMQLYSYERRQSRYRTLEDPNRLQFGIIGFVRRLLIWHSQKILFAAMFYAAISPISAFGFLYLLGIVCCSILPKPSRVPSKTFLVYTGFLVTIEYLFQMLGKYVEMFPGQKLHGLSVFLGLKVYGPGFWGVEAGLRGKVMVVAACTLQYNVFYWLEMMPSWLSGVGQWEEPCPLFFSEDDVLPVVDGRDRETVPGNGMRSSKSWPSIGDAGSKTGVLESGNRSFLFGFFSGSGNEGNKWNKKRVLDLRKERFEMQKTSLKVYLKFWMENMFILFGLEITMIALLLASFALLNAISILYIASLAACVLLSRQLIRKGWPVFVFVFAAILVVEYFAIWRNKIFSSEQPPPLETSMHCHDCWRRSDEYFSYCRDCWLGLTVDDPRVLTSYFFVFMLACFKLRADRFGSFSGSFTYRQMIAQRKNAFVWRDLSFETKPMWTFLDYLRLYCYCHLLDLVLALILITGTFEYDILHLGYLAFALIFFRMRLTILKKKNHIFKWLRIYNFAVIVLSLAYQSPFVGAINDGKCETVDYIYEVIGFYKYDYGFRITSRSALVEIVIFILVSLQSYMFATEEFDYVFRYLEAEQIGAIVREQEKKAAWKTAQLQYIREAEEMKRQRNLQVEKMKAEMLDLQIQLRNTDPAPGMIASTDCSPHWEGLRRRKSTDPTALSLDNDEIGTPSKQKSDVFVESLFPFESLSTLGSPKKTSLCEITEFEEDGSETEKKSKAPKRESSLISAVQLIGDGVTQVQSIGNQARNYFNIPHEDSDSDSDVPKIEKPIENEQQNEGFMGFTTSNSMHSDRSRTNSDSPTVHIVQILRHIWAQMRSNNDVVCYCCFLLVFLWNFSLLSMVYLAALFLYALCVNTGPSYTFWVVMLIYTEFYILIQYGYQIIIQHCGFTIQSAFLSEWGFPSKKISSSFVISLLPLFLVYLFTLIQSSITANDSELVSSTEFSSLTRGIVNQNELGSSSSWRENGRKIGRIVTNFTKSVVRNCTRYWKSLTQEAESPPYLVQLSIDVHLWPEDGIQPSRIESGINELLRSVHDERCKEPDPSICPCASTVQVQSIERSTETSKNVALASLTPAADVAKEITEAQQAKLFEKIGFPYPIISVIGGGKREIDLYAYTFGADLVVFFLVMIFYQSVIKNKSELLDVYQLEDQFPKEFVFILMAIFFLIVLDRIIYLCSFATGKVVFYVFNLVLFTYSVTLYAWATKPSVQNATGFALRAVYLTKSISLALQAMQIRSGVPHKSTLYRQFLTSSVSRVNYLGYRLYRALPFLYELRCVLDWSCTTTSLTMYDWLKLEDINASLYLVKCDSVLNRANHKQGEKQTRVTKFCNGICLFFILMCVIWAPMLVRFFQIPPSPLSLSLSI